jgi:hypothetical protein
MITQPTPRQIVKALLRGESPRRPLLLPIVFSLGARLEDLALRDFQCNPTKITRALVHIHNFLKVDGLACYFDPFLEAETLGCTLNWQAGESRTLTCPPFFSVEDLRRRVGSLDDMSQKGRIPVVRDVLQRLKVMLKDEPALMVGVSGPLALAAQLQGGEGLKSPDPELVAFAAEAVATVSENFVESGADVILLAEKIPTTMSAAAWESWHALLDPIINVIRFYEALPVLLINGISAADDSIASCLAINGDLNCVFCPSPALAQLNGMQAGGKQGSDFGIAFPASIFRLDQADRERVLAAVGKLARDKDLVLLTTAEEVPVDTDMKQLGKILSSLRTALSQAAG